MRTKIAHGLGAGRKAATNAAAHVVRMYSETFARIWSLPEFRGLFRLSLGLCGFLLVVGAFVNIIDSGSTLKSVAHVVGGVALAALMRWLQLIDPAYTDPLQQVALPAARKPMTYRQTYVVEYQDSSQAPRVSADLEVFGGKLYAVQFSDALEECELWREHATYEISATVERILNERWQANR